MAKKITHGGARKGAGRKPAPDPKHTITLYVETSIVNALGGVEELKEECYSFLKNRNKKNKPQD